VLDEGDIEGFDVGKDVAGRAVGLAFGTDDG
jgi:hypothetical protein